MYKDRTDVRQYLTTPPDQPLPKPSEPEALTIKNIIDREADRGPLKTQTLQDPILLAKTERWRKPGEKILEFVARIGASPDQLMRWPDDVIDKFVRQAEENDRNDGVREPTRYVGFDFVHGNTNQR